MIKEIVVVIFLALFMGSITFAQVPGYEIIGKITNAENVQFTFEKFSEGKVTVIDTLTIKNGTFKITGGPLVFPEMVALVTLDRQKGFSFFLENSRISVSASYETLGNAVVTGSKSHDEYYRFVSAIKPLNEQIMKLNNAYKTASDALLATQTEQNRPEITNKFNQLTADYRANTSGLVTETIKVRTDFIRKNPGSYVSPLLLSSLMKELNTSEIDALIKVMDKQVVKTPVVVAIRSEIDAKKATEPGNKAPGFTLNDPDGKPVSLYSKIGVKLLLVDFWAGWCGPCRRENPNVVRVYNEFHPKGFDVIGVSLDRERETWLKAIEDDKLVWTQVSDLTYFNSDAARLYNVNSIPSNFLLDEKGIIVAVNLRGDDLFNKVRELIDKK